MGRPPFLDDLASRRSIFEARADFLHLIRDFFRSRGFLEVDPPLLVAAAGMEPHLDPFEARGLETGSRWMLPTSPEFYLKKLVASGVHKCFSLAPSFRDEPPSHGHAPEFLMLEWYRANEGLGALIEDCDALLATAGRLFVHGVWPEGGESSCNLAGGIQVMSLSEVFERIIGRDWLSLETVDDWRRAAQSMGASGAERWTENDCFSFLMISAIEPALAPRPGPVVLQGYPAFQAALARLDPGDPRVSRRFELYAAGVELANAYEELTDGAEQRGRFERYQTERASQGKVPHAEDPAFMEAVGHLPPCSGIALGADRLLALLLGEPVARVRHGVTSEQSKVKRAG